MFKFRPKVALFFLSGFLIINGNNGLANYFDYKPYSNKSTKKDDFKNNLEYLSEPSFSNSLSTKRNQFKKAINRDITKLYDLIAQVEDEKKDPLKNKFSADVESDVQYREKNIFYAEGNAIIKFSDAKLTADKFIYDRDNRNFIAEGKVTLVKGAQFFEASKFEYNFLKDKGYINNVYGILDVTKFADDFDLLENYENNQISNDESLRDLRYINSASIGLVNDFEINRKLNITDLKLEIPQITKWRFIAEKINLSSDELTSKRIFFTNDPYNKPQFQILSKNFITDKVNDKVRLLSKNSWIILDQNFQFPIGRRSIFKRDRISKWSIGSDYSDMDGVYISRSFENQNLFSDFNLALKPYYFIQRSIRGSTNSFREKNVSILNPKEKGEITFGDNFGLGININKNWNNWEFDSDSIFYSLNPDRLSESFRSKNTLTRTFPLKKEKKTNSSFENLLDFQIYNSFREEISKGLAGEAEIYYANGLSLGNIRTWEFNNQKSQISFIYDFGEYKAERKNIKSLDKLYRNVFVAKFSYEYPLWQKNNLDKNINVEYKYSPKVIQQGLKWKTIINAGLFFYSDDSTQKAVTLGSGPEITLGSFKRNYFDYTNLTLTANFSFKNGESPFVFDDISETNTLQINLNQQLIGPLVFSYLSYLNLDPEDSDYGKFKKPKYGLNIERRAYSVGAFYDSSAESVGVQFNIFNFDYLGRPPKF